MESFFKESLFLIKQISDKFEAKGTAGCKMAGLTMSQFRFLIYLKENKNKTVTQKELEIFFKVSHPAVNGIIKRLEEKGFVSSKIVQETKMQKIVKIEQKGLDAMKILDEDRINNDSHLIESIPSSDWEHLYTILKKVQENM